MPTNTSKGNHGHPDAGSQGRGNQKATYGSSVSPDVAEEGADTAREQPAGDEDNNP